MSVIDLPFEVRRDSVLARIWLVAGVVSPLVGRWFMSAARRVRRAVLVVGSMASVCYAAWQVAQPLGWLVIGIVGLYLEAITSPEDERG